MKAIYPGSFDPITNGHIDIINRCAKFFDEFIVAVCDNKNKNSLFSLDERKILIESSLKSCELYKKIVVRSYSGLTINFAVEQNAQIIVRGLRNTQDFLYEETIAVNNKLMNTTIETFFVCSDLNNHFNSSSMVKEIAKCGGNISHMVSKEVEQAIKNKFER